MNDFLGEMSYLKMLIYYKHDSKNTCYLATKKKTVTKIIKYQSQNSLDDNLKANNSVACAWAKKVQIIPKCGKGQN